MTFLLLKHNLEINIPHLQGRNERGQLHSQLQIAFDVQFVLGQRILCGECSHAQADHILVLHNQSALHLGVVSHVQLDVNQIQNCTEKFAKLENSSIF